MPIATKQGTKPKSDALPEDFGDALRARLRQYDRQPFIDLLAEWMDCAPSPEDIRDFANRHPDKYISALASLGQLAGFTHKTESSLHINVEVHKLSDSQLEDRLVELTQGLDLPLVEGEFEEVPAEPGDEPIEADERSELGEPSEKVDDAALGRWTQLGSSRDGGERSEPGEPEASDEQSES